MDRGPTTLFKYVFAGIFVLLVGRAAVDLHLAEVEKQRVREQVLLDAKDAPVIMVHVAGAVVREGVYALDPDSRVEDAVAAAGGFLEIAEKDKVNLAAPLEDGAKIIIPPETFDTSNPSANKSEKVEAGETVNINRASALELQKIPGVGPTLSARIIELRESRGRFETIDEIMLVQGIGPASFERMKKYLKVVDE